MSKVLIIEDETSIAELEKDYMELSGFDVDSVSDGEEGLKKALEEDYDLIVLDLMLPGMDGFDVCKQIRDEKNVPIIIVSARKEEIDKIRGLGLGADDYMTKPFSPSELVARAKAHMARYERLVSSTTEKAPSWRVTTQPMTLARTIFARRAAFAPRPANQLPRMTGRQIR